MHLVVSALVALSLAGQSAAPPAPQPSGDEGASLGGKARIAILGLRNDGVDAALVAQVVDALALVLSRHERAEVLTASDIDAVLGLEATRQALDCDEGSCAAMEEITRALDVRYTIAGSIAPRERGFYVYATLIDMAQGRAVKRAGVHVTGEDYPAALAPLGDELLGSLLGVPSAGVAAGAASEASEEPADPMTVLVWAGAGVAGVGLVVAAAGGALWLVDDGTIRDVRSPFAQKKAARDRYLLDQAVAFSGGAVAVVGAALLTVGLVASE